MIKVIAFDYADVISLGPLSKWVRENLVPGEPRWLHYKKHTPKWDRGEMTLNEVYDVLSEITGIPSHLIWDSFYKDLKPDAKVVEQIKKLKKNYRVFLFSNFHAEMLGKLLEKQGIKDLFDQLIISSEHKFLKPEAEFYKVLIKKAEVLPKEILFTDDRIINVEGASALGINAIQFLGAENLEEEMKKFGISI